MDVVEYHVKFTTLMGDALLELNQADVACFIVMVRQASSEALEYMSKASGMPMEVFDEMAQSYAGKLAKSANNLGI